MATPAPLPTPFDITPIPSFPVIPGLMAWLIVLGTALLLALIIARIPLSRRGAPEFAVAKAIDEIEALTGDDGSPRERLTAISLVIRRLLTAIAGLNIRSATAAEIRSLYATQPEALRPLLDAAAAIEGTRFLPEVSEEAASLECETLMSALREAAKFFKDERSRR